MKFVWINGQFVPEEDAHVSVRDSGLLHAIGLFTTMRSVGGKVLRIDAHLKRLRESSEVLFIPLIPNDKAIKTAAEELLQRNELTDARLRLTLTRGVSQMDPVHGQRLDPTLFLTAGPFEPYPAEFYEKGLTVIVLDEHKLNPYDLQAGHKTLDYFSRLHALREANRRGAGEALWFNTGNYLQSGSISNVFLVRDGALVTPPTNEELRSEPLRSRTPYPRSNVLPGTTRGVIFDLAKTAGIPVDIRPVTINDLLAADEVFLTNSVMSVMPVCRIERKAIGNESPGPLTVALPHALHEADRKAS